MAQGTALSALTYQNFYPRSLRPGFFAECVTRSTCAETRERASLSWPFNAIEYT